MFRWAFVVWFAKHRIQQKTEGFFPHLFANWTINLKKNHHLLCSYVLIPDSPINGCRKYRPCSGWKADKIHHPGKYAFMLDRWNVGIIDACIAQPDCNSCGHCAGYSVGNGCRKIANKNHCLVCVSTHWNNIQIYDTCLCLLTLQKNMDDIIC